MRKKVSLILFICTIFMLFSGCEKKQENQEIRIAYFPNITHAQALVMKNKGELEKKFSDTHKIKWTSFNSGTEEIEAFFAGEIDLGYIGPVPAINGYIKSQGDIRIIAGVSNGGAVLIKRKDSEINNISDLSNKIVAVPSFGNTQHLCLLDLMKQNDLKPTSDGGNVNVVTSSNADILTLMSNKEIDAALVPEPWGSILEKENNAEVMVDYNNMENGEQYSTAVVIISKEFLDKNPEVVKEFLEVHKSITNYINDNIDETKKIVNEEIEKVTYKPIDEDILNSTFLKLSITNKIPEQSINKFAQISYEQGIIRNIPDNELIIGNILE